MDDQAITEVVNEIQPLLVGRTPGKLFQLSPFSLAIDFRLRDHGYLLISVEPTLPRIHLIKRRVRDLEKQSGALSQFALALRKKLSDTELFSIEKDRDDRIVRFLFKGKDALGQQKDVVLLAQLTGRAANLFLLDGQGVIGKLARPARVSGQQPGEKYEPPASQGSHGREARSSSPSQPLELFRAGKFSSLSEALDAHYTARAVEQAFDTRAAAARAELKKKISRQEKLLKQLQEDLASHANAQQHRHIGDLLLANAGTAKRTRGRVQLVDYFAAEAPLIEIDIDEKLTLPQEAARRFELYSRSKRAVGQINSRMKVVGRELDTLYSQRKRLEKIIKERDATALEELTGGTRTGTASARAKLKREEKIPGTRRYLSSDGFEILVGRGAGDNDHLTFKVARPNDLWLHAGDYPGSHVVVRNATRKEIPHRTIIEAAQLAAHFSQARKDSKVAVHYTPRKFLSKPKGAAPGLVRMSRFKNITVEPRATLVQNRER